jgi:hypothetical protein
VFDEKKLLSWRMKAEEFKDFHPGRVIKKNGKFYIKEMQALRLPVYDMERNKFLEFLEDCNKKSYYKHPTRSEKIFLNRAKEIRNTLQKWKKRNREKKKL